MATLLLSRTDKRTRGQDLRRTLLHLLHGLQAVENALTTFLLPLSPHADLLSIPGHPAILANFDAHVGDTACHMRAQMIWEVYEYYKIANRRIWFDLALVALARIKADTFALMLSLHRKNGYMRALGFGSIVTYGQIFDRIGWSAFIDMFDRNVAIPILDIADSESCCSRVSTPTPLTPEDLEQPQIKFLHKYDTSSIPLLMDRLSSSDSIASRSSSLSSSSFYSSSGRSLSSSSVASISDFLESNSVLSASGSSHNYRSITKDFSWDVTNQLVVLRFLTLCRLLSVGKRARVQAGFPNAAVRARTDPEFIYEQTEKDLEVFYNSTEHGVKWNKLISTDDRAKKACLVREEEAVQVWLSNLTADWAVKLGREVGLSKSMQSFLQTSVVTSPRRIACVASHTSIIPIRAEWLLRGTPILMVIRRFCSKGYHSSFYRVIPNTCAWPSVVPIKNIRAVDVGQQSWFLIEPVAPEEVCTATWSTSPHFVLISNSIEGTSGEFYDRVAGDGYDDGGAPWPHNCNSCEEHNEYWPKVLDSNFSRIIMGFFGQHNQYPFDLVSPLDSDEEEDGHEHVGRKMRAHGFGERAMRHYWRACKDVEESGTGECPWMYTFEHAYTELPFVVGRQVEDIMERGMKPVPLGYRWWS